MRYNSFLEFLLLKNKDYLMSAFKLYLQKDVLPFEILLSKLMFYYILLLAPFKDVDSNVCECLVFFVIEVCEISVCSLQSLL